jgi:hypothetical protein
LVNPHLDGQIDPISLTRNNFLEGPNFDLTRSDVLQHLFEAIKIALTHLRVQVDVAVNLDPRKQQM